MRSLIGFIRQTISGLRFRLLLLLLLACAPLLALTVYDGLKDRREAKRDWEMTAAKIFRDVRSQEKKLIDDTRQLLLAASQDSGIRSMDPGASRQSLEDLGRRYPRYSNLGVVATNGDVFTSLMPVANKPLPQSALRRAVEQQVYNYSRFPLSRADAGPTSLFFCHPVQQQDGTPVAVVFAEINLVNGGKSPRSRLVPEGATWTELDRRAHILTHTPDTERLVGRRVEDNWLLTNVFSRGSGLLESPATKGTRMIYAFHTARGNFAAPGTEIAYVLRIPRGVLFAAADKIMWQNIGGMGVALGVAMVLGWVGSKLLILRPVEALARSSARLASGDLSVRTGLRPSRDELGQLTVAFDQMAQALEQREQDRQRASHKLQALSYKLVEVQETERRHIARELHDEIGQSLTAAEMNLQAALQMRGPAALERRLEESIQAVERVLEQVHDLSLNLRPSMLDDLGLEPALRWYTHRQAALTGLRAEFHADIPQERLDPIIETECFRVAQEALTNVVRHAKAQGVSVDLSRKDGHLHLSVRDDGMGFDVSALREKAVRGASLGLLSMEERASLAGGGLELNSAPGMGTEVHAWFPLKTGSTISVSQLNE